jgi:hypothetical protein
MSTEVEIRVKLRLDSSAEKQANKVKHSFEGVHKAAEKTSSAIGSWATQTAAVVAGNYIPRIVSGFTNMVTETMSAANAAYDQEQALGGLYATMGDINKSWETARMQAEQMRKSLRDMADDIGQAPQEVLQGYSLLIRNIGKGSDENFKKARVQTEQLTVLANVMGYNVEALAGEFGAMHKGVLRMRGPLVDILRQTGVFGDNIAQAVSEWRKLSDVQREAKLADALKKQADRIGKAAPTISDLMNTFKGMKEAFIEDLGAPVIRHLLPVMQDLKDRLKAAKPAIERLARTIGMDVARWVDDAAEKMREGFKYLKTHGHEIKADLKEAATWIKDAFQTAYKTAQYIIQNKGTFAAIYGGSKLLGAGGGPMAVGQAIAGAGKGAAATGAGAAVKGAAGAGGMVGFGAGLAGVAALTAAVVALGLAADQAAKLINETSDDKSEAEQDNYAKYEAARREFHSGNMARARELATQVAGGSSVHRAYAASLRNEIQAAMDANKALKEQIQGAAGATTVEGLKQLITAYNTAVDQNNVAMMQFAGKTLIASGFAVENFSAAEMNLTGGIDTLRTAVGEYARGFKSEMESIKIDLMLASTKAAEKAKAEDLARDLRAKADAARKAARGGGGGVSITINEIKQEFRKADPDRIVVAFKKDIIRRASRRVQSKRATVFGV